MEIQVSFSPKTLRELSVPMGAFQENFNGSTLAIKNIYFSGETNFVLTGTVICTQSLKFIF